MSDFPADEGERNQGELDACARVTRKARRELQMRHHRSSIIATALIQAAAEMAPGADAEGEELFVGLARACFKAARMQRAGADA